MWNIKEFMYMSTQNGCSLAISLIETESQNASASFKQNMAAMASDGPSPHSPSLRIGLPAPQTSIGDHFWSFFWFSNKQHYLSRHHAQSCWAPHYMTQERIMFSNPTPSKLRLSPVAIVSDDTLSALTPPLHCASILQPATSPQVVAFES